MPSSGTTQQLKVDRIAGGKRILQDTSLLLNEIYSALQEQDARALLRLPTKIQLAVTSIHVVQETLDDVLRYDGNLALSNELISAAVAQENKEKKIFKIIRYQSRQSTTKGTDCPLRKTLENGMKQLKDTGRLILTPKKLNAIIDCGATSPKVKGKAYSEQSIKKSYIDTGFINEVDACPNIFGVMKASNVPFSSKPSLEKLITAFALTPFLKKK